MARLLHKNITNQIVEARNKKIIPISDFSNQISITKRLICDYKSQITELKLQESGMNTSLFKIRLASLNNLLKSLETEYQELLVKTAV